MRARKAFETSSLPQEREPMPYAASIRASEDTRASRRR